jgi:hypothetical protein
MRIHKFTSVKSFIPFVPGFNHGLADDFKESGPAGQSHGQLQQHVRQGPML